jgi:anaerobic dimethyl sulfoxide reductase subunit B (iron-sulfur subunit)
MAQYGFFFDQSRCIGCYSCTVACKDWNDIPPGPAKWLRIHQYETGSFPNVRLHIVPVFCFHCETPICLENCSSGAIYKEEKYGTVLVDSEQCEGCRKCRKACPYGAPQFQTDDPSEKAQKCTMCIDRLEQGMLPMCVTTCPMRALDFGLFDGIQDRYGTNRDLRDMPKSVLTKPAVIYKPMAAKKTLVPYPVEKALDLIGGDVTAIDQSAMGQDKLLLKPKDTSELWRQILDQDG